jgi:hypothetical protein
MGLLSLAIWYSCNLLIVLLIYRGLRRKLFVMYPYFFSYIALIACSESIRIYLWIAASSQSYKVGYWITEFLGAIGGFAVTWEVYAQIMAPYRGLRRMTKAVLSLLLVLVVAKAVVELGDSPLRSLGPTTVELERNLRALQALLLLAVVGLVVHYAVPMGRNIRSILMGYGFYIGCHVIALSFRSQFGNSIEVWRDLMQRLAYLTALIVWCVGVWSYAPNPVPNNLIESDYDRISAQTSRAFGRLREHVTQSWRP